jgi:hypothetical protein
MIVKLKISNDEKSSGIRPDYYSIAALEPNRNPASMPFHMENGTKQPNIQSLE